MKKIEELIREYNIEQYGHMEAEEYVWENTIMIYNPERAREAGVLEEIKERKQEILDYLAEKREEEKRAREERQRKIEAIEGLKEIADAIEDLNQWQAEFTKSFDDVGGLGVRPHPEYDLEAMYEKYPAAKAYIDAKKYKLKSNVELSFIGDRALERIIENPEKHEEIMADMQKELHEFTEKHMWD